MFSHKRYNFAEFIYNNSIYFLTGLTLFIIYINRDLRGYSDIKEV